MEKLSNFNEEINFLFIWKIIKRKRNLMLFTFLSITSLTFLYNLRQKPIFEGSFEIVVKDKTAESGKLSIESILKGSKNSNDTQKTILRSPSILLPVFDDVKEYRIKNNIKTEDFYYEKWLDNISVNFKKDTSVLQVNVTNSNKDLILFTLKTISSNYQEYSKNIQLESIKRSIEFLTKEKEDLEKKAFKAQKEFNTFSLENGLGSYDGIVNLEEYTDINPLSIISGNFDNDNNVNKSTSKRGDAGQRFRNQFKLLAQYESDYTDLSSKLKSNSKTLLTLKARIDNLREYLKRPNEILINHGILREKSARTTGLLYSTENALALAKITLNKSPNPWEMISSPTIKRKQVSPKIIKNLFLSSAVSVFIGILISLISYNREELICFEEELKGITSFDYLETFYKNDPNLNTKIINGILEKNNLKKDQLRIILINKSSSFTDEGILFDEKSKILFTSLNKLNELSKESKVIIIIPSNTLSKKELNYIDKYITEYKDKILGLGFLNKESLIKHDGLLAINKFI